jgi:hypothetical protein
MEGYPMTKNDTLKNAYSNRETFLRAVWTILVTMFGEVKGTVQIGVGFGRGGARSKGRCQLAPASWTPDGVHDIVIPSGVNSWQEACAILAGAYAHIRAEVHDHGDAWQQQATLLRFDTRKMPQLHKVQPEFAALADQLAEAAEKITGFAWPHITVTRPENESKGLSSLIRVECEVKDCGTFAFQTENGLFHGKATESQTAEFLSCPRHSSSRLVPSREVLEAEKISDRLRTAVSSVYFPQQIAATA